MKKKDVISGWDYNRTHIEVLKILTEHRNRGKYISFTVVAAFTFYLLGFHFIDIFNL